MRFLLKSLTALAGGAALGLAATWLIVVRGAGLGGEVVNGPWRTSLLTGSAESGMYLRATVALHGLLALNRSETIYYTATTDSAGEALDGRCSYGIAGTELPARWWSITAYGAGDYLIANAHARYSVSKQTALRTSGGRFAAYTLPNATHPFEIATRDGAFSLTLRLYNPDPAIAADPAHVALPQIVKGTCTWRG